MQEIVSKYLLGGDPMAAQCQLHELGAPAFHHEFVTLAFNAAASNPAADERIKDLLDLMVASGTISQVSIRITCHAGLLGGAWKACTA